MNKNNIPPYITVIKNNNKIYYGILKIKSKQYITLYNLEKIKGDDLEKLLHYCESWWWQSNRKIPISIYMQEKMNSYDQYTIRFNTDQVELISGPCISLSDLPEKRIKRRNTILKKKPI